MAGTTGEMMMGSEEKCSFCGRPKSLIQAKGQRLIAGPVDKAAGCQYTICSSCVDLANNRISHSGNQKVIDMFDVGGASA